jgi:flavin reductase (DIM6/NTAB) family NADH-FMN oxidoreductase RutF
MVIFKDIDLKSWYYILHPRPVTIVISGSWDDYSAMAASWVTPASREPPIAVVAIARNRYTYEKILMHKEFALCLLESRYAKAIHTLGSISGRDIKDKIAYVGLTKIKAKTIPAPVIKESIAIVECRLRSFVEAGDHDLILGDVNTVYIKSDIELLDTKLYKPLLHVGKNRYTESIERFIEV